MPAPFGFDLETYLIAPGAMFPKIVLGAKRDTSDDVLVREDILDWIEARLDDGATLVNQSIAFDLGCAAAARPHLLPKIFAAYRADRIGCTKLLCQLVDIGYYGGLNKSGVITLAEPFRRAAVDSPHKEGGEWIVRLPRTYSLQAQAKRWLDVDLVKDETRITYAEFDGVPVDQLPERQREYVLGDLCAVDLWSRVHDVCRNLPLDNVWAMSRRDWALALMEARGRYIDPTQVANLRRKWTSILAQAFESLKALGFLEEETKGARPKRKVRVGWSRPKANRKAWAARWGLPSLTATALQKAMASDNPPSVRVAGLVAGYLSESFAVSPARERFYHRAGLWEEKTRTEFTGPRPTTGRWILKEAPCQAYAEATDKMLRAQRKAEMRRTPTGLVKLDDLNAQIADNDPTLQAIVDYRHANGITSYIDRLAQGVDRPLHFKVRGVAATGRTTSGGGDAGLNDQNWRRGYGFREANIPRKGHAFWSVDYAQIELCAIAQIELQWFGRSAMADAINAGKDCHVRFAALLDGVTYDEGMAKHKAKDPAFKELRNLAKAFNFGKPGGLGMTKFITWAKGAYGVDIEPTRWSLEPGPGYVALPSEHLPGSALLSGLPPDLARRAESEGSSVDAFGRPTSAVFDDPARVSMRWLRNLSPRVYVADRTYDHLNSQWLTAYPEKLLYLERVKAEVRDNGNIITQFATGRQRGNVRFTQAANGYFQSLVADGATEALFRVQEECYAVPVSPLYGSGAVWFVHDEIGGESPLDRLHEAAFRASEIMVSTMREYIPDVRVEAEPAAMRRWTKGADGPRYGADGRLICEEDWRLQNGGYKDPEEQADVESLFARFGLEMMR